MEGVGSGAVSAPFTDAMKAECVIVIGARPTVNHPVAATFFKQAAKRGTKLIVIDPRGQDLMRHATYSLRFKPGSDVAMLNSLMHTIIEEKLYDEQYIQAERVRLRGAEGEGQGLLARGDGGGLRHRGRDAARRSRAPTPSPKRSIIFWGMGISQHTHGTDNARCLIALALITGHIGRPGTGLHPLRGQNNVQGASDAA